MSAGQVSEWDFQATKCETCGTLVRDGEQCCKTCPDCDRTLPLTEEHWYPKQSRRVSGEWVKRWDTYCRQCKVKRNRHRMRQRQSDPVLLEKDRAYARAKRAEYRKRYPERDRAYNKRRWQQIKSDPELYEQYILTRKAYLLRLKEFDPEAYVIACQDARITPDSERRERKLRTAVGAWQPGGERVDPTPFRHWIEHVFPDVKVPELSVRLGLADKQVRNIVDPDYAYRIDMRIIDRALVNIGRPDVLNELYPLREESGHG